jgi:Uma2 family endonuclease
MANLIASPPGDPRLRRFSVADYHRMIETGILDETDKVELLEGNVVLKMPRNPPHDGTLDLVRAAIGKILILGWIVRTQQAITLIDSEPEPDITLARGDERSYLRRHPSPADIGMVMEVSDSSLDRDRGDKARIYAAAAIPIYWIINLVDRQIEVYSRPGPSGYALRQDFTAGSQIPFVLDGAMLTSLNVDELLP